MFGARCSRRSTPLSSSGSPRTQACKRARASNRWGGASIRMKQQRTRRGRSRGAFPAQPNGRAFLAGIREKRLRPARRVSRRGDSIATRPPPKQQGTWSSGREASRAFAQVGNSGVGGLPRSNVSGSEIFDCVLGSPGISANLEFPRPCPGPICRGPKIS